MAVRARVLRVLERIGHLREQAAVVPLYAQSVGERPKIGFAQLRDYYLSDKETYAAVNFLANRAASPGFYVTCNPAYPEAADATKALNQWNTSIVWGDAEYERGLDGLGRIIFRELLYGGNSLVEMVTPEQLQRLHLLQLSSLTSIKRTAIGKVQKVVVDIPGKHDELEPAKLTHFAWNVVDRQPIGSGLLHALAEHRIDLYGKAVPNAFEQKTQMEQDIRKAFHRYGVPRAFYAFKNIAEEKLRPYLEKLRDPDADASFGIAGRDVEVTVASDSPDPRVRFESFLDYLKNGFYIGLQTPYPVLISTPGQFSEASARVAGELGDIIIQDLQRLFKRVVEQSWYRRVLQQHDPPFDPDQAQPTLHFGDPDKPQYEMRDIVSLAQIDLQRELNGLPPLLGSEATLELLRDVGLKIKAPTAKPMTTDERSILDEVAELVQR